jgi:hypothetical protein
MSWLKSALKYEDEHRYNSMSLAMSVCMSYFEITMNDTIGM